MGLNSRGSPSPYEGRLVRLRAREPEDEPLYYTWLNDPLVTEHLGTRYPVSHAVERRFLESQASPSHDTPGSRDNPGFGIETLAEGKLIGSTGLHSGPPENRAATLGIFIGDTGYWDGGYGTDAMRVLCRVDFDMMNLHRIELDVFAENKRALHVYEKVGFRIEARRRDACFKFGRYQDLVVMGLLEDELRL